MTSNLLWMALGALTGGLVVAGGMSLTVPAEGGSPPLLTRVGDRVHYHMAIFDDQSRMLVSTRATDRAELERVQAGFDGLYVLPSTLNDTPQKVTLDEGRKPIALDVSASLPLGQALLGKPVGYVTAVPIVGHVQGYENVTTLERTRGPFNRTLALSTATLDTLVDEGGRLVLDDALHAEVIERGERVSRIRVMVADGQVLAVRNVGFEATVRLDEGADQFYLRLDARVGHEFVLTQSCEFARYVLPLGSYRVTDVDEDRVTLASSPTRWPQMIGRDLVMFFEILKIERQGEI